MQHGADSVRQDFLPNLQRFLLPKIKGILTRENGLATGVTPACSDSEGRILVKADRMYRHNLMRLNYTTYDVRRAQDVINPSTSHCNIMLLADSDDPAAGEQYPYLYARVLGIYHVNATYIGPGMIDYRSHRIDFLWVRWYQCVDRCSSQHTSLDRVYFPPMAEPDTFGFVDPDDVLRCCHIIPHFAQGLQHLDGKGISHCAQDKLDWRYYYVNRCVN